MDTPDTDSDPPEQANTSPLRFGSMDIVGTCAGSTEHTRKRKIAATVEDDDDEQEGVIPAEVVEGSKHGEGSI